MKEHKVYLGRCRDNIESALESITRMREVNRHIQDSIRISREVLDKARVMLRIAHKCEYTVLLCNVPEG